MPLVKDAEERLNAGEPLSVADGCRLFVEADLLELGRLANTQRERLHGNKTYYNQNLHLNATNVCEADCLFCSFARLEEGMPQAYTMSIADAQKWITARFRPGMTEIHIVNGLHAGLPFEYYEELLQMIRSEFPELHIKGFTAVEIHYFSEKFDLSYRQVLERLVSAGLQSLPGGGAEIFSPRVRKKICRDKVDAAGWLAVHRTAHDLGLKSNCTMLYGTIETPREICEHLAALRGLQSETGGFQAFVPLAFHNEGNRLAGLSAPTGVEDLRVMALSRLMLHNIPNIKAYWVMLGIKTAQVSQSFGANDMDGTVTEEKVYHMAGSRTPDALTLEQLRDLIRKAGRLPVERNTLYQEAA